MVVFSYNKGLDSCNDSIELTTLYSRQGHGQKKTGLKWAESCLRSHSEEEICFFPRFVTEERIFNPGLKRVSRVGQDFLKSAHRMLIEGNIGHHLGFGQRPG